MDSVEFEKRLEQAFANNLPIPEKIAQLRQDLGDSEPIEALIDSFFNETLFTQLQDNPPKFDNFYRLCQLHFKVANSVEFSKVATTPVKNTKLWQESVLWLAVYFKIILILSHEHEEFDEFTVTIIFWWLKWILTSIVEYPSTTYSQIVKYNKLFAYYSNLFELGERSLYKALVMQGIKLADTKMIETNLYQWLEAEDNDFDDCLACQYDDIIRAYCFLKKYDKALAWADEILDGSVSCGEVPHVTNSLIAQAYFYTNQKDKAIQILEKGYSLIRQKLEFVRPIAEFMRLYCAMDMVEKATVIYEENKAIVEQSEWAYEQMLFYIEAVKLPIAEKTECFNKAYDLASRFDTRNGNDYYLSQLPKAV